MFNVDFNHIASLLLPSFLRTDKLLSFLKMLISPVKALYLQFFDFRNKELYLLKFTGQVIYLEKLLNDKFQGSNLIYITDGYFTDPFYLFNKAEGFSPVYLQNKSEAGDIQYLINIKEYASDFDFIVNVPASVYDIIDVNEMTAYINMYKLVSKYYKINRYE